MRFNKYAHKTLKTPERITEKALQSLDAAQLMYVASTIGRCPRSPERERALALIREEHQRAIAFESRLDP